ncbi:MAG: DNA repair protein RecN [Lachnospiraceae bacterium]|nr:DNA repair protein RecN [Lachnospiraceae bacterium]
MLQSLHVKNLALMEETEVEFGEGLNILTGETGAGKSLLIGSINLALGAKFDKEMLREGAEYALVELIFDCQDEKVTKRLEEMELLSQEDGIVIISRKMQVGKSVYKINGETVTAKQVKELAEVLIDIHGQHEHQSLLHKKKHMEILDSYCGAEFEAAVAVVAELYKECTYLTRKLAEEAMDEEAKAKEQALAEFEYQEIEAARLVVGEDEKLEQKYRVMSNSRKITEGLAESYLYSGSDSEKGAGSLLSRALRSLRGVASYDSRLEQLEQQLSELESLLVDYNRDVAEYINDCEFEEEDFQIVEERLNTINRLKGKYGSNIEDILSYAEGRQELLLKLADYDAYMQRLTEELKQKKEELYKACEVLTEIRQRNALQLSGILREALIQLNFLTVEFEIAVRPNQTITAKGFDDVEFMISTNPGESQKALGQVASGGELSRVMLAIKTVLAEKDAIDTLIFDEIDTGISGKTAWKVSEQLDNVAHTHQVICITHLPQIAAMADKHFVIEKSSMDNHTITDIHSLSEEQSLAELARLLGSDALTKAALSNAREMKEQARGHKMK